MLNALASARKEFIPPTPSIHRLRLGLPGCLIPFAPLAFAFSVRYSPGSRLRHWCSSRYLRISPLHREFRFPLLPSSSAVLNGLPQLSRGLSRPTYRTASTLFTPSKSGKRSRPTCYRGCWHVVSRRLFLGYRPCSSPRKGLYDPKAFIAHAASLPQAFAHWAISPTAASRRSLARVSVPVWGAALSRPLPVFALVGHYPTN